LYCGRASRSSSGGGYRKIETALAARVPRPNIKELKRQSRAQQRQTPPADPLHILAVQDQIHDLEIELEEERERA
jgi:hypothetical protein